MSVRAYVGTTPDLDDTILDSNGRTVDLTGAVVTLVYRPLDASTPAVSLTATVDPDQTTHKGSVSLCLGPPLMDAQAAWEAWWRVVWENGTTLETPNFMLVVQGHGPTLTSGAYATAEDTRTAVADYPARLGARFGKLDADAQARLLSRASRDVDRACRGPLDPPASPLFGDLAALTSGQVEALREATLVAAVWRLAETEGDLLSVSDYTPAGLSLERRAGRPPSAAVLEVLSGAGLIHRSGTVAPDPLPDYVPSDWLPPAA